MAAASIAMLDAVDLPIVVISHDCRVTHVNRAAMAVFGLTLSDIGRSPGDILPDETLDRLCGQVFNDGTPRRHEIRAGDRYFLLRLAPYIGSDQEILGTILTFTNITAFRASINQAIYEREYTKTILNTVVEPLVVLDAELRIQTANRAFYAMFGVSRNEAQGVAISDVGDDGWKTSGAWEAVKSILTSETEFQPIEIDRASPGNGIRTIVLDARRLAQDDAAMILLALRDITAQKRAEAEREALIERERAAHEEAEALNEVARALGSELEVQKLLQTVTDVATKLTGAQFGAFFYNVLNEQGESYTLYTLSGASREAFEKFGMMPRNTPVFSTTFSGLGPRRSDDIRKDPDYGKMAPHYGMPQGHLPVCSYLAVPVKSRSGEVLGGLFFGHSEPGIFTGSSERLAAGIASHAAIALDNARLYAAAEQEARASRLLALIVGSSDDAIISKDLNGVITSWNKSAERLFGYTVEEALGRTVAELLTPPDRQDEETAILARLRKGERVDHFETVRRRKNGTSIHIALTISPVMDRQGRIVGASKVARDITQRKTDEQRMAEQARQLELTTDAILVRDGQDRILYWNRGAEDMYGFSAAEALGKTSHDLLGTEFSQPLPEILQILSREGHWSGELTHARRDGSRIVALSRWVAERDENGNVSGILESNNDITDRVHAQAQLRRANQDLEHFAYSATHDLREPLRTVKIYSELLASQYGGKLEGNANVLLDHITRGATRMDALLNGLMVYAQTAGQEKSAEPVDAASVLSDVLANLARTIDESGAKVTADGPLPSAPIHRVHLQQILQNLIGNAIKFRRPAESPIVQVSARREKGDWLFCVVDNGIGIAPQNQEGIFGLFKRLHSAEQYSGAGIGLALCHRVVELYGGRIWVESQPGHGSSFYFTIPA